MVGNARSLTAAAQLRRLLHLLPEVADGRPRRLEELSERAGIDRKTLLADLRQLAERYDDPGGFVEGVRIFLGGEDVEVFSTHFLRPMRLTLSELRALELGLAMLAQERPPEERRAIEAARNRLREAIAKLPDQDLGCGWLDAAAGTGVNLDTIAQVRRAIQARRVLRLNYQSGSASKPTWRDVQPLGLVFHSGMWYLVADGRGSYRFFRADRIQGVTVQKARFDPPAEFSLEGLLADGAPFSFPVQEKLVVRYSPRIARWIAEREGKEVDADGSLTAEYRLGDAEWAARFVLQFGAEATILAPEGLSVGLAQRLASARRR